MERFLRIFVATLAIAIVPTAPATPTQGSATTGVNERSVLLLTPCLVFEKLKDESPLDPVKFGGTALGEQITIAGESNLRSKGFGINVAVTIPPLAAISIEKLQSMTGRLARGSLNPELRTTLGEVANRFSGALILAQYLRVRVGAKGYVWTCRCPARCRPANPKLCWPLL